LKMYFAGLNTSLTLNQCVGGLVVLTDAIIVAKWARFTSGQIKRAEEEGGKTVPYHDTFTTKVLTPIQMATILGTPIVFGIALAVNGLEEPEWVQRFSLPSLQDDNVGTLVTAAVRVLGCVATVACFRLLSSITLHLGAQFHFIAVREKAKIVTDGPYAHVRHPIYSVNLLQQLAIAAMFYSYVPLIAMGILGAIFAVKIPTEERLIENTPSIAADYAIYKQKVRYRLIPGIW